MRPDSGWYNPAYYNGWTTGTSTIYTYDTVTSGQSFRLIPEETFRESVGLPRTEVERLFDEVEQLCALGR